MSSSVGSEAPKKDGALIGRATDRAQGGDWCCPRTVPGDLSAFLTEEALLRLEGRLRAQREQQGRRFAEQAPAAPAGPAEHPNEQPVEAQGPAPATTSETVAVAQIESSGALRDCLIVSTRIEPINENTPFALGAYRPKIRTEEPLPSPSSRRREVGLLLCALLLVIGAAALGVSLRAPTGGSTDADPVNIEGRGRTASVPPDNDKSRQSITNAVSSAAATSSPLPPSPAPPNEQLVEARGPAMPAASEKPALSPQCNIPVCQGVYRSFRSSDCTYKPSSGGPRRVCDR
jgi:hypothetical protein